MTSNAIMVVPAPVAGTIVTFDSAFEKGSFTPVSPFSFVSNAGTVTGSVGNNANRVLIITVGYTVSTLITITAVSWNGVSALAGFIGTANSPAGDFQTALYGLINPATGANSLSVSWTTSGAGPDIALGAISLYNCDQATGWRNATTATGTSNSPSISVTSSANNMAVASLSDNNSPSFTETAPTVKAWAENTLNGNFYELYRAGVAGSTTLAGTLGAVKEWAMVGVEVIAG